MPKDRGYSRAVYLAKLALPMMALALLASLFLLSNRPNPDAPLTLDQADLAELARDQRLTGARFSTVTRNGRALDLSADEAMPDAGDLTRITARNITLRVTEETSDNAMSMRADQADIDTEAQIADLSGDVRADTNSGYTLVTDEMSLSLADNSITAPSAVALTGPNLQVDAEEMRLFGPDGAQVLIFNGRVRVLYTPEE